MPVTVGDLREFLSDSANSMADAQGGRIINRVIKSIMRRLSREGAWVGKRRRILLSLETRKQADFATLTQGSPIVSLDSGEAGAFEMERRFYDEKWNIQLGGRETVYQFAEHPDPYSLKLSIPYAGEDTAVGEFDRLNLSRSRYSLPVRVTQIYGVELPQQGVDALSYLPRGQFEVYRRGLLTSANQPWVYTVHNQDEIEFWPPPSSDQGYDCEIDLQEALRIPAMDAENTEELDWPDHMEDLLWACARMELALQLGPDAVQFDAGSAAGNYKQQLSVYKTEDSSRGAKVWSMSAPVTSRGTRRPFGLRPEVSG